MSDVEFTGPSWSWANKDYDRMNGYLHMKGRSTIRVMLDHLREVAPGRDVEEFGINFGTITWSRSPTQEERDKLAEWRADRDRRHEEWEMRFLAILARKHGKDGLQAIVRDIEVSDG